MTDILLTKHERVPLTDVELQTVRRVLFGIVDGLGDQDRRAWRRLWNWLLQAEPGEMVQLRMDRERCGPFHRMHMAVEQAVFKAQERFPNFKAFRDWLKVGAGFVDWYPGPKGGVIPVPKSISYTKCPENEMREFHLAAVDFLRTAHACKTLWPKLPASQRDQAIEAVLGEFDA
ncbi:DUF1367 family protein [Aquabacterium sp. A7-Y]|uniref:DUF1367 family protein n=1 Tax=Aquabacterium sp. A7-Y TaxID=1349605 RepID=UPI00223E568A|nr:DUF1367 family protein [Aquabacterium sp. A7-Y]MCW7541460.1 DUF1367 family protein [Aquabacterium sp. A7-Y]